MIIYIWQCFHKTQQLTEYFSPLTSLKPYSRAKSADKQIFPLLLFTCGSTNKDTVVQKSMALISPMNFTPSPDVRCKTVKTKTF